MEKKSSDWNESDVLERIRSAQAKVVAALFSITKNYSDTYSLYVMERKYGLRSIWYNYTLRPGGGRLLIRSPYRDALELLKCENEVKHPSLEDLSKALKPLRNGRSGDLAYICEVTEIPRPSLYRIRQGLEVKLPIGRFVALATVLNFDIQIIENTEDPADLL